MVFICISTTNSHVKDGIGRPRGVPGLTPAIAPRTQSNPAVGSRPSSAWNLRWLLLTQSTSSGPNGPAVLGPSPTALAGSLSPGHSSLPWFCSHVIFSRPPAPIPLPTSFPAPPPTPQHFLHVVICPRPSDVSGPRARPGSGSQSCPGAQSSAGPRAEAQVVLAE